MAPRSSWHVHSHLHARAALRRPGPPGGALDDGAVAEDRVAGEVDEAIAPGEPAVGLRVRGADREPVAVDDRLDRDHGAARRRSGAAELAVQCEDASLDDPAATRRERDR